MPTDQTIDQRINNTPTIASTRAIGITAALGLLAAFVLPPIYIMLNHLIPNIWFSAITAALLGLGIGGFINFGITVGKLRSRSIATIIAVCCGLLGVYVQWVFFDAMIYSESGFTVDLDGAATQVLLQDFFFLFTHPTILFDEVVVLNEYGTFSIERSSTVSGPLLWLVWTGEVILIVGGVLYVVLKEGSINNPYSDVDDAWFKKRKDHFYIPYITDKSAFINELNRANYDVLSNDSKLQMEPAYAEVMVYESPGESVKYINVVNVSNTSGKAKDKKVKKILKLHPVADLDIASITDRS